MLKSLGAPVALAAVGTGALAAGGVFAYLRLRPDPAREMMRKTVMAMRP